MKTETLIPAILERKSIRAFADTPIPEERLQRILEAARWAPSSMNEQPWRYVIANKGEPLFDLIASGLMEANRVWAAKAPVLIVSLAALHFSRNNQPNRHALYDTGAANALLSLQAAEEGIQVHQMGGIDAAKIKSDLGLAETLEVVVVMALGYPGDATALPSVLQERENAPRTRKMLQDLLV
ncbi:MAG: nitroreductase family protein [Cytophagaceae bacterium]|jgi:nitroreductase|nr:nitroreductase family protein [Cytophagaceae bacterium]